MKKSIRICAALLLLAILLCACGSKASKQTLAGQWVSLDGGTIILRDDGTGVFEGENMTWYVNGDTIVIESLWYGTRYFDFSYSGNTMVIGHDVYTRR